MTFKGMLKILINEYRKQHDEKLFSIVQELMKTRRELREVKEQLHTFQVNESTASSSPPPPPPPENRPIPLPTISLYVQYKEFFNQFLDIRQTMTIEELLVRLHHLTGIPLDCSIRLRVLSEDGLTTLFFLHEELHRTLESYNDCLKPRMILSIEENTNHQENRFQRSSIAQIYSFDESAV